LLGERGEQRAIERLVAELVVDAVNVGVRHGVIADTDP
jgi:hypothetical protein